jgi:hypothetical protein
VIVDNFDIDRPWRTLGPLEANPPLIIDADAVLALAVATESLQAITADRG